MNVCLEQQSNEVRHDVEEIPGNSVEYLSRHSLALKAVGECGCKKSKCLEGKISINTFVFCLVVIGREEMLSGLVKVSQNAGQVRTEAVGIQGYAQIMVRKGMTKLPGARFGIARRMRTSPENPISPNMDVTPDVVAQRSDQYGIVAEVKVSLPKDRARWRETVDQLRKYDDDLVGWWTKSERIPNWNAVLLVDQARSREFIDLLCELGKIEPQSVGSRTVVIEFGRSDHAQSFLFLRSEHGRVIDAELSSKLKYGCNVPLQEVIQSCGSIRFYDARPPLILLLNMLWTDYFPSILKYDEYDDVKREHVLHISADTVAGELQRAYGSGALGHDGRSVEFPCTDWIRGALEVLVEMKLAKRDPADGHFVVSYRSLRGDVIDRFVNMLKRGGCEEDDEVIEGGQLPLALGDSRS